MTFEVGEKGGGHQGEEVEQTGRIWGRRGEWCRLIRGAGPRRCGWSQQRLWAMGAGDMVGVVETRGLEAQMTRDSSR